VLIRRGHRDAKAVAALLDPPIAPDATDHFPDLCRAVERLEQACQTEEAVAICGDYDADGMTSTALLVGVLKRLGANPVPRSPAARRTATASTPAWWKTSPPLALAC